MPFTSINEAYLRLAIFIAALLLMTLLELRLPKKLRTSGVLKRWFTNASISVLAILSLRFFMPILAIGVAAIMAQRGWGLFNLVGLPMWLEVLASVIILDMLIYWQHVASHRFTFLWSFHKVHHADRDIDASTAIRFHPVEIVLSMAYKIACVSALGAPVFAVFLFEILLSTCAIFNHANLNLPQTLDKILRKFLVTPDMHRVHHSTIDTESNRNFGFCLPYWDYIFNSYQAQPKLGHDEMHIGLGEYQDDRPTSTLWSLILPFDKKLAAQEKRT